MKKQKIVFDVATIYPGKGGAGGGIWNYAKHLLIELDKNAEDHELEIICIVNKEFPLTLKHTNTKIINLNLKSVFARMYYAHILLPLFCWRSNATLHKPHFEIPIFFSPRLIVTIHDLMADFYLEKRFKKLRIKEKLLFKYSKFLTKVAVNRARLVVTPSETVRQEIIEKTKIIPEKVVAVHLAADISAIQQKKPRKSPNQTNLYCIAAFHRHKGHFKLIELFNEIQSISNDDIHLFLRGHIGDVSYYDELMTLIDKSLFKHKIHLIAYETSSKLDDIYNNADWVILLSEYEGFGLPIIEAQSYQVPVICSNIPIFNEVGRNSVVYVDMNIDNKIVAQQLMGRLNHPELKASLIEKGIENCKRFSWRTLGKTMEELYTKN